MSYQHLAHHGIKGQKWGIRRFQNQDGSLTEEGRERYSDTSGSGTRKANAKKVAAVVGSLAAAAAITAGAVYYSRNKDTVNAVVKKFSSAKYSKIKDSVEAKRGLAHVKKSKKAVDQAISSLKNGGGASPLKDRDQRNLELDMLKKDIRSRDFKEKLGVRIEKTKKTLKDGFNEGLDKGIKKAEGVVIGGAILYATKKGLDKVVGNKLSDKIFKAANPKKVNSFWTDTGIVKDRSDND